MLWDATTNKLYIASHFAHQNAAGTTNPLNFARLYRYSYIGATHSYTIDSGFPVVISQDKTEAMVLTKDSTGRLWITYISRKTQDDPNFYKVYINATTTPNNDLNWGTPIAMTDFQNPGAFTTEGRVSKDDISAIVAFRDNGGNKVGILWSNQYTGTNHLNFAWHLDSNTSYNKGTDWTIQSGLNLLGNTTPDSKANDHMNIKALRTATSGQLFAAIKFENRGLVPSQPGSPQMGLLARDVDGTFIYRKYSTTADNDSRPLLMLDEGDPANASDNVLNLFVSGLPDGDKICYKSLNIPAAPANLATLGQFPVGNCGAPFILDASGTHNTLRDPSSTKQNVNNLTGLVVLASDLNSRMYVHNTLGNPPPVVTAYGPTISPVVITSVITATFSKPMDVATLSSNSFMVLDGVTPVTGTLSYNSSTRTVTFTPNKLLKASTTFTVKLTNDLKDTTGLQLDAFKNTIPNTVVEQWTFFTDLALVQFARPTFSQLENGVSALITVSLASPSSQPITVTYTTSDGSATAGQDYTAIVNTVIFEPGATVKTFPVGLLDDLTTEGNETVNLALSNPVNANLTTPLTATLTIIDDEGPVAAQFTPSSYVVSENDPAGKVVINVSLSHPTTATVTVDYAVNGGTATVGQDYTLAPTTLTFAPGETSKSFDLPVTNDNIDEPDETINLSLSNPTGNAVLGVPGDTAIVTIKDTSATPVIQFDAAPYTGAEAAGTINTTVKLSNPSAFPITVNYATSDGTATATDYTSINTVLTFVPGETSKIIPVTINEDTLSEANETVNLTLSNATNATLGDPAQTTATITDNDALPSVQFATNTLLVAENVPTTTVTVQLSTVAGRAVAVHYSSSDGTAIEGVDYVGVDDTLIIPAGQISATFTVAIINDTVAEPSKTVNLTLDTPTNATLGAGNQAVLTILDDDIIPQVQFSNAAYNVSEGVGTATITVSLTSATAAAVTVNYSTSDGTAKAGQDYASASGKLTFAPGQTSQTFTIMITQDNTYEQDEIINLALGNPSKATLGTPASAPLTILNDDSVIYMPLIRR
ncbi:MAG: Ig-like domain-containing protein [Chloroflexi bacterium]|nr:Ig-like domain-containing protein [Chloroflexota bacterium]